MQQSTKLTPCFACFVDILHSYGLLFHEGGGSIRGNKCYRVDAMANLQVKSIDDELYRSLGKRAEMENRSISQEVVSILKAYLSMPSNQTRQVNKQFLDLCGTWEGGESADEMIKMVRESRLSNSRHRNVTF